MTRGDATSAAKPAGTDGGLFLGLISGTSVDGIDAALVSFEPELVLHAGRTFALPDDVAREVLRVSQTDSRIVLDDLGALDTRLGMAFADAANTLIEAGGIDRRRIVAIGSHGQTLRHRPSGDAPFTMQLGDASVIAERTGITTIADFRRRDVAAGGHGAPLVPAFHAAIFRDARASRAILNIGGIANLTLLPMSGHVRGFDTGPGNGLMDAWCLRHRGERFDRGGAFAASGSVDPKLLLRLLSEPWFALPPPKSTGRDQFHLGWLESAMTDAQLAPQDVQATLCALTVRTIVDALRNTQPATERVLVCGGGVHNTALLGRLGDALPGIVVESTAALGVDPDLVEAMAFAWLARETLAARPGNLPEVTGARGLRVLGAIHSA